MKGLTTLECLYLIGLSLILVNGDRLRVLSMFAFPFRATNDLVDGNDGELVKVNEVYEILFSKGESKLQNELE